MIFSQSKIGHGGQVALGAGQHYAVPLVGGHRGLVVAADEGQVRQHAGLTIGRQIRVTACKLIQIHVQPVLALVAGRQLGGGGLATQTPVAGAFPGGATPHVPVLGHVAGDGFAEQRNVEVAPLCRLPLVLVQLYVDAAGQLGPVGV